MMSKEEILNKEAYDPEQGKYFKRGILEAMQTYADQSTAHLQAKLSELEENELLLCEENTNRRLKIESLLLENQTLKINAEKLERENEEYKLVLNKIANPIEYLQKEANKKGGVINTTIAIQLSENAAWLKSQAKEVLEKQTNGK